MTSLPAVNETTAQGTETFKNKENNVEFKDNLVPETELVPGFERDLAAQDPFHDSGFFEPENFQADSHGVDDYNNTIDPSDLDLDLDFILADFFKDTSSTELAGLKNDTTGPTVIPNDLFHGYHDIANPRSNTAYKAIVDFENHAKCTPSALGDEFTTPLHEYARAYERHESIAYRLEHPANAVCASQRSGDAAFVEPAERRKTQQ